MDTHFIPKSYIKLAGPKQTHCRPFHPSRPDYPDHHPHTVWANIYNCPHHVRITRKMAIYKI